MVLQAPDSLMGNWFAQFWLQLEGAERDAYLALFDDLNPVDHTARLGDHVLEHDAVEDEPWRPGTEVPDRSCRGSVPIRAGRAGSAAGRWQRRKRRPCR